jgi:hypothetical protein
MGGRFATPPSRLIFLRAGAGIFAEMLVFGGVLRFLGEPGKASICVNLREVGG